MPKNPKKIAAKKEAGSPPKKSKTQKQGRARATAEQISDANFASLLHSYVRRLKPKIADQKFATAAVQKLYELAKKEGVPKKDIELAIKLETEEGEEKIKNDMARALTVIRHVGSKIGQQLALIPKQSAAEEAYEDGKRAALQDKLGQPPQHLSQANQGRWMEGFHAGNAINNEKRLSGFKPLAEAAHSVVGESDEQHEDMEEAA